MGNDYQWRLLGTKNHGDKIVDVIHLLSSKVPKIFLGCYALDVEISLKYGARWSPHKQQSQFFIFLPTILETNGEKWGLMETIEDYR